MIEIVVCEKCNGKYPYSTRFGNRDECPHCKPKPGIDEIYRFIVDYKQRNDGNSPTVREIVKAGLASSTSVADDRLNKLAKAGLIKRATNKASHIIIIGATWTPPEVL